MPYKPSQKCYNTITKWDGLRLTAYKDSGGLWTIGYGTTSPSVVFEGNTITKEEAETWLKIDTEEAFDIINARVKVPLPQPQAYNIGDTLFSKSTLLKKLNSKDYMGAWSEFPKCRKAGGDQNWRIAASPRPDIDPAEAAQKARNMEHLINDQLEDTGYGIECRKVIEDRVIYGTGIVNKTHAFSVKVK